MRSFHNIEKSGFHRGQYVGYAAGLVYRIRKIDGGRWMASNQNGGDSFTRDTLADISKALDATAEHVKASA